jgi:hypothetical protein
MLGDCASAARWESLVEIAATLVADLQPPVEWAGRVTAPTEARSQSVMPGTREHAAIVREHMIAMTEVSSRTVATSRLLDGRRRSVMSAARDAVEACERARRRVGLGYDTAD